MADYSAQFEALRSIATKLTKKEEVSAEEWTKANMPPGTPLKKVNTEITKLKKLVSTNSKTTDSGSEEEGEGAGAGAKSRDGHRQDARTKKDVRRLGADSKSAVHSAARGEGGLGGERVGSGGQVYGDD
jgi:hypothetical protein